MAILDGGSALYSAGYGGGCCSGLCRVALMFITLLSTTFTIGTLVVAGSALYSIYNEPDLHGADRQDLIQLWVLVIGSAVAVFMNVCGFMGAMLRIRCLLLLYAVVIGLTVAAHVVVIYMQRTSGQRLNIGRLNITDDPHSVWTAEMSAYAAEQVSRTVRTPKRNSTGATSGESINKTVKNIRKQLAPNPESVRKSGLKMVNTIQSFLKCCGNVGVDDFIKENITIPESCCVSDKHCNATLRLRPRLDLPAVREMSHKQACGPFLHAGRTFMMTVITWVSYVVAGSQLCGAVIAIALALCCTT